MLYINFLVENRSSICLWYSLWSDLIRLIVYFAQICSLISSWGWIIFFPSPLLSLFHSFSLSYNFLIPTYFSPEYVSCIILLKSISPCQNWHNHPRILCYLSGLSSIACTRVQGSQGCSHHKQGQIDKYPLFTHWWVQISIVDYAKRETA